MYYAILATNTKHAKALARKARKDFGEGYQRGEWVIIRPCSRQPWAWREALPSGEDWNAYSGDTPAEAAHAAGLKF